MYCVKKLRAALGAGVLAAALSACEAATTVDAGQVSATPPATAAAPTLAATATPLDEGQTDPAEEPTQAELTNEAGSVVPLIAAYDGGDGYETALMEPIRLGQPETASLDDLYEGHNWLFEGRAGQTITVRVEAAPGSDTDPRLKVIDPAGVVLAQADDPEDEGRNAALTISLPVDGVYTLRVDVYVLGEYVITATEGG